MDSQVVWLFSEEREKKMESRLEQQLWEDQFWEDQFWDDAILMNEQPARKEKNVMTRTENFMNTSQVAGILKICETTVRRMVMRGELKAIRIGRNIRISPEDLQAFMER
jgi:excisionase family DNA binding protein